MANRFDSMKDYYIFKYVYDPVKEEYTDIEGDIQCFVKATNCMEALENAGFDNPEQYDARQIDERQVDEIDKAISKERKHLSKLSKQVKEYKDEKDAEHKKFLEERPCPNNCGKMDEQFRCEKCGYGFEQEQLLEDIKKAIKEGKKNGDNVDELKAVKKALEKSIKKDDS